MNNDRQLFTAVRALPHMTIAKSDGEYRVTFLLAAIAKAKEWSMKRCQDHVERVAATR